MACPYLNFQWLSQAEIPGVGIFRSFSPLRRVRPPTSGMCAAGDRTSNPNSRTLCSEASIVSCLYATVTRGISLGCPLSPLMAALYLELMDRRLETTGLTYARFMDDWVILAPHAMEPSACGSNGQRGAPGTAGGATPGQDVHRAD